MLASLITALHFSVSALSNSASSSGVEPIATMPTFSSFALTVGSLSAVTVSIWIFSTIPRDVLVRDLALFLSGECDEFCDRFRRRRVRDHHQERKRAH